MSKSNTIERRNLDLRIAAVRVGLIEAKQKLKKISAETKVVREEAKARTLMGNVRYPESKLRLAELRRDAAQMRLKIAEYLDELDKLRTQKKGQRRKFK